MARKRARELGIIIGEMPPGAVNAITDVPGVMVGHTTLYEPERAVATGVSAILPHSENTFHRKVRAACHIINGRGKPVGLAELREFGLLETPIILTSTLQVGMAADALVRYMLDSTPEICDTAGSVNPVVLECSDMYLNDARSMPIKAEHVVAAIESAAGGPVAQGCVGAGTGMRCLGFKSGIGTASRRIPGEPGSRVLGVLVLSNFGRAPLVVNGVQIPAETAAEQEQQSAGSIVVVVATDAAADARQLGRIARRAQAGMARAGSRFSSGSGDFVVAFTTSQESPVEERELNALFRACQEAAEEAILDSIFCATTTRGRKGRTSRAIDPQRVLDALAGRAAGG